MLKKLFKLDVRWYVVIAIAFMALVAVKEHGALVATHIISICLISCVLDFIITYVFNRKTIFPLSALVSGLIIATVLAPARLFYLAPLFAILSKHLIRCSGRHIFNPAAFGLLAVNLLWGLPLSWWLVSNITVVFIFGFFLAYRIKKLGLIASFLCALFVLSIFYSLLMHQAVLANIGVLNLFFAFFMLPEPKTSPVGLKSKLIYGVVVALFSFLSFAFLPRFDFLILGLVMGNIVGVFLRKVR